jgi:hypothetical protein
MPGVKVPADVEREDRLAFGLTARQLAILAGSAVAGYGLADALGAVLPEPLPLAAGGLVVLAGLSLALLRHAGLAGDRLALAAARFVAAPRRRVLAPEGLPAPLPGAPKTARVTRLELPLRAILSSGVVELGDGSHCLLLTARGSGFELRAAAEQAALVAAFARFLNGLSEPLQIVVQSERISLEGPAGRLEQQAATRSAPIRAAARSHAAYLRSLGGASEPLRRRRIVLVLRASGQRATAEVALARAADQAGELLAAAGVELTTLAGEEAAALLARSFDPPGPGAGVRLTGTISAAAA